MNNFNNRLYKELKKARRRKIAKYIWNNIWYGVHGDLKALRQFSESQFNVLINERIITMIKKEEL